MRQSIYFLEMFCLIIEILFLAHYEQSRYWKIETFDGKDEWLLSPTIKFWKERGGDELCDGNISWDSIFLLRSNPKIIGFWTFGRCTYKSYEVKEHKNISRYKVTETNPKAMTASASSWNACPRRYLAEFCLWQHRQARWQQDTSVAQSAQRTQVPLGQGRQRLLNGKVYSIVTDQLSTLTEAYNAEGEEVYDRNSTNSEQIRIPFLFQGQYYDHETELAHNRCHC